MPSKTANPARLVVGIAGACGLMACTLLLWHFAFAQPVPIAPATATFVTQPPVQPVTPVPVAPQAQPASDQAIKPLSQLAIDSPHTALVNISDGTANTVFGGMVAEGRAVPWTKPDDLVFDDSFQTKENALVEGAVMFADGSIRHMQIQGGLDRAKFRLLFSIGDGQPSPLTSLYPPNHQFAPLIYKSVQDQVRQAEARTENKNSLKAIMLAFHNYHQVFKHFPPATVFGPDGKPWHSWRVLILPYLGQKELADQYDATVPWDHPKNAAVLNKMPKVYRDPLSDKSDSNKTRYLLVTGAGTAFPTKPTGNVVAHAPVQTKTAQPAPPKPVAKDGREPIEYQPMNPAQWKAKNHSTWLFPWEGERVVLLTTSADFDPKTMAVFLKRLDAAWKRCGELVGESPWLFKHHKGKVTIVAVPDPSLTFDISGGYGFSGGTGVEVVTFYGPQGDFERVRKDPDQFPDRYVYLMAMNHSMVMNRIIVASMGSATLLRHLGLDGVKPSESETQARQAVERFENVFAQSKSTFAESFNYFGAKTPRSWSDINGKPYPANDLGLLFASIMLKLRQENGGDEWIKKFYRHLHECPPIVGQAMTEPHVANAQLVNWVIATSLASEKDLLPLFRDRWRFPLPPEMWQALQKVDWKKSELTADNVVDALPVEHLPLNVVMSRPSFLTPERRKQNILLGGTFEDDAASKWKLASWRNNNIPNGVIESGVVKEGQQAAVIRNTISDDVHFDQLVTVKPGTRYLLSGWIKTKDVVIEAGQQYGQVGANIGIGSGYEHTRSTIVGTTDWTYVTLIFDSGTRTEATTFARLGYANSIVKGEAWFDDLSLIPIGPSPVRPGAQSPTPAPGPAEKDNLLVNGSFEEGPDFPENFGYLPNVRMGSTAIKGWSVTRGNIDCVGSRLWIAGHGQRSIDLHGTPGFGGVKQTFKTVAGQRYQVSFLMAGTPLRKQPIHKLAVHAADKQHEFSFDATGKTQFAVGWERKSWEFVAGATETTLEIHTLEDMDGNSGPIIDDVSVIALGAKAPGQPLKAEAEEEPTKSAANWKGWPKDAPPPAIAPFNAEQAKLHQEAWAKHLGVPVEYTNSIGMKFRLIPPGEFVMGATAEFIEASLNGSESPVVQAKRRGQAPQHKVILTQPIYLGVHEVTQGHFESVTGTKPSHFAATGAGRVAVNGLETTQHPVDSASWDDVAVFCAKLSEREKLKPFDFRKSTFVTQQRDAGYRLPTEAEWERACRAGTVTTFWPGNSDAELLRAGWFGANSKTRTHAVGELRANPFGLHDVHGNVWEWVLDAFDVSYYQTFEKDPAVDPTGPAPANLQRGLRGGGWQYTSRDLWASFRHSEPPTLRHRSIGFRVALSVAAVKTALTNPVQMANANARQKEAEGDKHRDQKEYAQAIACYREAVQHEPNNAAMLNRLAWVLAVSPQKDQPVDDALRFARRASLQQPGNGFYRNSLGAAQYRAGQYAEALSNLGVVAEAPPKSFGWLIHNLLFQALCHERMGDRSSAQATYFVALDLLKQASGDSSREHEARLLQSEIAELGVLERVPEVFTLKGHTNLVLSVAFSPDGKIIASGSADRTLKLWDAASGQELRTLKGELSTVTRMAFSPDGQTLAAPGLKGDTGPGDVTLWEVATGTKKATWKGHFNQVWAVAFSPDGKQLASSSTEGMVKLWDANKGQEIRSWQAHTGYVLWVAFSPDGKRLATGGEDRDGKYLKVWDLATGQEQLALKGHTATNGGVAFGSDGKRLVSGSSDKTVKVWDANSGQELRTLNGHTGQVGSVVFSADGKWIASACYDGTAKLWDSANGQETRTLRGQQGGVSSVAISPDGKRLVTGNSDQTVRVWDISEVKPISVRSADPPSNAQPTIKPVPISGAPVSLTLQSPARGFSGVAFSSDGQRLVTSSLDQTVRVWDSASGEERLSLKGGSCATLSPDGKWLASGGSDKVLRVWDAGSGQEKLSLQGHTNNISGVAFSLDGQRLASASDDQTVKVWDATSGKESLTLKGHSDAVRCVAFSADGKRLASAGRDQTVKLRDAATGEETHTLRGHKAEITSIAFSPDGTWLASASHDQSVKLWNCANGKVIRTLEGHDSGVLSVNFSADGKRLVSASSDQTVRVWDSASGQPLLTLKGHASQVIGAALSPDGSRLASASFDRTVKVWDLAATTKTSNQPWKPRQPVRREYATADKEYLAVARDSRSLINGDFRDGLNGWLAEAGAQDFQTVTQGNQTTLTTAGPQQDADTGRLYQYFKVPDDAVELQFSLRGGADSEQTHVALWHGTVLRHRISGRNDNSPFPVSWNVMSLRGQIVSLEIVDQSLSDWGFLGVQGFQLASQKAPSTPVKEPKASPLAVDPNQVPLTLKGHSQQVTDVAFNADGTRIASASQDGTVKLWDAITGQVTHTLKSSASRLAFSPDGKRLATGGHDKAVTLWDVATGQVTLRLNGLQPAILGVAFAPDGQRLAAGSADGTLKVWDITNGQETLTVRTSAWQVAFSPDGKQLATASTSDQAVKLWDATTGDELLSMKLPQGGVNSLMFSPDGKRLATSGHPAGPTVWDLSTGQVVLTLKAAPWSIAFDPTGQWIATGHEENGVLLSDAATGRPLATLKGNTQRGSCVAFSVDGKRLAAASDDLTVKVWDLVPGASPPDSPPRPKPVAIRELKPGDEMLTLKGHGGDIECVVFSADGKRLVTASEDQTAKIWDAADGRELLSLKGHTSPVTCVAITTDGKQVASGGRDQLVKLWDATTGRETHSLTAGTNYLTSVAFSPDGKRLASAAILAAKVWDTTTGQEAFAMQGHFANVNAIVFSHDGKRLASCSHDMTIKLRDAANGRETLTLKGHRDAVSSIVFSPDGKRLASASHDQTLKVWDTTSGKELLTLIGHTSYVTGVATSADGKRLASVSWDSTARLWNAETGQELLTVKGHSHRVNSVAFSPDGKRLATASDDRTVKLWDITLSPKDNKKSAASSPMPQREADPPVTLSAETARATQAIQDAPLTITLKGHTEATTSLAVSPDGKWLGSASSDGVVVWDVADRKARFTLRSHGRYAISSVAISSDGKRLAAGVEKVVKVWDAATGAELQSLAGNTGRVNGIAFSSDGQCIASATQDQSVTVWDSTSGKVIDSLKEKLQSFGAIAFSPDGQWLAAATLSGDTTGKVWKANSHEESFGLHGHNLYIKCLAFSADGKRLASASDDGSVKIWDTLTGDDLLTLRDRRVPTSPAESRVESRAHQSNQMKGVALSPDGRRLVTAGSNGFVSVWDAATGQKLLSLEGHQGEVRGVVFSPDGKWVASAGADATVKVWTLADRPTLPPDGTILKANVDPKKAEADLKALEGTWQITDYATSANQPLPPEVAASIKEQRVVFQGDVLTFASKGRSESMVITVDPTQPLKAIDFSSFDQGDSFRSMLGVYSLTGDTLKLAMSPIEAGRPKELKPGDGVLSVMTLTRTKSSDAQPTDSFNFHAWRPASKNLQRMNVKAKLANRESLRVAQLDRGFGLPETIFRWGVIGLPAITGDAGLPDVMWKEIASISHIVVLTPSVNDALLNQLSQHKGLIALHVTGAWSATAASIAELKNCPRLMNIGLEGSPETMETVRKLTALSNLRDLTIYNATASKELLSAITQFKELESLNLPDAGVTDDLVEQISTLKNLKFLVLQQARAADKDKLKLSDKGLRSLMSLKELKWLDLQGHTFSAEAAADFKASLPNCQVLMTVTNTKTNIEF